MKRIYGLGLARRADDHQIDLGRSHPVSHGGLRIHCQIEKETITKAQIEIGFMHRGVEGLFTERDYRQGVMLASRHDWSGPSGGELAYALAIEDLLGLITPIRASWIRVFISELDRILSALTFLSAIPEQSIWQIREAMNTHREAIAFLLEKVTGARMHHQVIKVGGVAVDLDQETLLETNLVLGKMAQEMSHWHDVLTKTLNKYQNVGILNRDVALGQGASGIIARASGLALDVRVAEPYLTYEDLSFIRKETGSQVGDIPGRVISLLGEVDLSIQILLIAIKELRLSQGDSISEKTPKVLRLPEGQTFRNIEGSLGSSGVALFSDGGRSPMRVRLRTASFGNLAALEPTLVGLPVTYLPMMLASWPFLSGDSDR